MENSDQTRVQIPPLDLEYLKVQAKTIYNPMWVEGFICETGEEYYIGDMSFIHSQVSGGIMTNVCTEAHPIDPNTIRRWSGQRDNTGAKIWEGDVYRETDEYDEGDIVHHYICFYVKELAGFCWLTAIQIWDYDTFTDVEDFFKYWAIPGIYTMDYSDNHLIKVIANVYDSPKYLNHLD